MNRSSQTENKMNNNNETILDILTEKAENQEIATNQQTIHKFLEEAIKIISKREKETRQATVTISQDQLDKREIIDIIEKKWTVEQDRKATTFWQDNDNVYCQFSDKEDKEAFLLWSAISQDKHIRQLRGQIEEANIQGTHFQRKPIKIVIQNVRGILKTDLVQKAVENTIKPSKLYQIKESRMNPTKVPSRNFYMKIDSEGFKEIFEKKDGAIIYMDPSTKIRTKMYAKINVRPFQCRNCFVIGAHKCTGRICNQCGNTEHSTITCKSKTRFCSNCKRAGHRAKDTHCTYYLNELAKEIRKMEIPLEYLGNAEKRQELIRFLQIK